MQEALILAGIFIAEGLSTMPASPSFLSISLESILVFFSQLGYIATYLSLLICLVTVIATLLWYPHARKKFSSPIKNSGLSVAKLILGTAILIIIIQIGIMLLYSEFLYQISFYLFFISLMMFAIRNLVTFGGAFLHKRREKRDSPSNLMSEPPLVSVIVPAYNEEKAIGKTVESLLGLAYSNKEIIIVDDGSTDGTLNIAKRFARNSFTKVIVKANGGKWDALNTGIKVAKGEFIVCIDADTLLDPNAIQHLIKHFRDPHIAAVAGNVKVGNRHGLLTKLQALEYVVGINLHRRSEANLQNVTVVPGPIGAFRTSVIKEIGLFEGDTFAEDADITFRILKAGYKTAFEVRAFGYTEAPTSMTSLAKQRYRWYRGSLQVLSKHRDMAFNTKYGRTGTFVMPWRLFNGIIYPWFMFFTLMWLLVFCFNPISPYTVYQPRLGGGPPEWAPGGSSGGGSGRPPNGSTYVGLTLVFFQAIPYIYVFWFLAFVILEIVVAAYALSLDVKEKKSLLLYTVLHRLSFLYILDIIRMLSQLEETFHYPMKWEKMDHHGIATL
ncbi:MAG: glycosyltransferase family 2 protein [Candidatus Bathyarchaeota archaeon]|nr:MAG: glycosyltransferase family 2 protein [Candidatus Bathyarchaeota archaeon]